MLTSVLHRIVSIPRVYDLVQRLAGTEYVDRRLAAQVAQLIDVRSILDLGGGTGLHRNLWSSTCYYVCLDMDRIKLQGFTQKWPNDVAVLADGSQIPLKANSLDIVVCCAVAHHLPEFLLKEMIHESARVLKPAGRFVFLDAVWEPRRLLGCLIWKYDRGSYPRRVEVLRNLISTQYTIAHEESFSVYHEYFLCVATRKI